MFAAGDVQGQAVMDRHIAGLQGNHLLVYQLDTETLSVEIVEVELPVASREWDLRKGAIVLGNRFESDLAGDRATVELEKSHLGGSGWHRGSAAHRCTPLF